MKMFKGMSKLVAASAVALSAGAVQAAPINVGGVVWDPDTPLFDFSSNSNLIEDQLNLVPGPDFVNTLTGFGQVTGINQTNQATFCPGCELTYVFGGYTVSNVSVDDKGTPLDTSDDEATIEFSGGWIEFYVDSSTAYDANDQASAGDGLLWLRLEAHDVNGASLVSELTNYGNGTDAGTGIGLLDVHSGAAASNFDTDTQTDGADFVFSSSFQPLPNNAVTDDGFELFGTADLRGESIPVPATAFLLGLGLLGMGVVRKRTK